MIKPQVLMMKLTGMKSNRGFSMLEMIVVITLIATVVGIFIVRTAGMQDQRWMDATKGDLRAIQTAINSYYFRHANSYPSGTDWMTNDLINDNPRILREVVRDRFNVPPASSGDEESNPQRRWVMEGRGPYSYFQSSDNKYYVVVSYGPDRQADITGINTNGKLTGNNDDDIFVTNGTGTF